MAVDYTVPSFRVPRGRRRASDYFTDTLAPIESDPDTDSDDPRMPSAFIPRGTTHYAVVSTPPPPNLTPFLSILIPAYFAGVETHKDGCHDARIADAPHVRGTTHYAVVDTSSLPHITPSSALIPTYFCRSRNLQGWTSRCAHCRCAPRERYDKLSCH